MPSPYCTCRYRSRPARRGPGVHPAAIAAAVAVAALAVTHVPAEKASTARGTASIRPAGRLTASAAGARAVAYARAQIGQPYLWGGTGPGGFDCSGLTMQAWAAAGIRLERTAAQQWDSESEHRVSTPRPGDLVFFAGSDGSAIAPGHVGIVTDPARHLMINAYATGWGVLVQTYGLPSSAGGDSPVIGFTDPTGGTS